MSLTDRLRRRLRRRQHVEAPRPGLRLGTRGLAGFGHCAACGESFDLPVGAPLRLEAGAYADGTTYRVLRSSASVLHECTTTREG